MIQFAKTAPRKNAQNAKIVPLLIVKNARHVLTAPKRTALLATQLKGTAPQTTIPPLLPSALTVLLVTKQRIANLALTALLAIQPRTVHHAPTAHHVIPPRTAWHVLLAILPKIARTVHHVPHVTQQKTARLVLLATLQRTAKLVHQFLAVTQLKTVKTVPHAIQPKTAWPVSAAIQLKIARYAQLLLRPLVIQQEIAKLAMLQLLARTAHLALLPQPATQPKTVLTAQPLQLLLHAIPPRTARHALLSLLPLATRLGIARSARLSFQILIISNATQPSKFANSLRKRSTTS